MIVEDSLEEKKLYAIKHIIFRSGIDKYRKSKILLYVYDTKEKVDKMVNKLNKKNKSYFPKEPYDDPDWDDTSEDYMVARELKPQSSKVYLEKVCK